MLLFPEKWNLLLNSHQKMLLYRLRKLFTGRILVEGEKVVPPKCFQDKFNINWKSLNGGGKLKRGKKVGKIYLSIFEKIYERKNYKVALVVVV